MKDIDLVSPDGLLRFLVRSPDGDITLGFDGFSWHAHGDILTTTPSGKSEEAAQRFIDDLVANRLIIAVSKVSGVVQDVWITDDPTVELRYCSSEETIEFRFWNGTQVRA